MSFAQLLFVTAPKCFRYRLGEIIFFFVFFMYQWIDARRGAPWDATCEKSVSGPCKVAGQGPKSESIRHYLDKECLEKNYLCSLVVLVRAEFA